MNNKVEGTRVIIKGRLSFVHAFKPHSAIPGGEEKYSTTILIPKTDVVVKEAIDNAIAEAENQGLSKAWNGVRPPVVPNPLWDGDGVKADGTPFGQECKGHWVMTASAKADYPPQVVDRALQPIINQSELYSGCWANVAVNFFPYSYAGKKGVGAGLGNIQKIKDDVSLAGTRSAQQDFAPIEDEEDII